MKKIALLTSYLLISLLSVFFVSSAQAKDIYNFTGGCTKEIGLGGCYQNKKCVVVPPVTIDGQDVIHIVSPDVENSCNSTATGAVTPPGGIGNFDLMAQIQSTDSGGQNIGIIVFASNLLQLFAIIAGIWAMFNFSVAGYMYITAMSDAGVTEKVKEKVTMTAIGLAIIAGSYIIAGLIGLVMFGDATFIINPKLYSVSSTVAP